MNVLGITIRLMNVPTEKRRRAKLYRLHGIIHMTPIMSDLMMIQTILLLLLLL